MMNKTVARRAPKNRVEAESRRDIARVASQADRAEVVIELWLNFSVAMVTVMLAVK